MSQYNYDALVNLWLNAGGDRNATDIAAAIALAESSGITDEVSSTHDVGLWQINVPAHPEYDYDSLKDPMTNARAAVAISSRGSNWRPWCTAYSDGACGTRGGTYLGKGAPYQKYLHFQRGATDGGGGDYVGYAGDESGPGTKLVYGSLGLPVIHDPNEPFPGLSDRRPSLVTSPGRFGTGNNVVAGTVPTGLGATTGGVPALPEPQSPTAPPFAKNLPTIAAEARQQTRYSNEQIGNAIRALEALGR